MVPFAVFDRLSLSVTHRGFPACFSEFIPLDDQPHTFGRIAVSGHSGMNYACPAEDSGVPVVYGTERYGRILYFRGFGIACRQSSVSAVRIFSVRLFDAVLEIEDEIP